MSGITNFNQIFTNPIDHLIYSQITCQPHMRLPALLDVSRTVSQVLCCGNIVNSRFFSAILGSSDSDFGLGINSKRGPYCLSGCRKGLRPG